MGPKALRGYGKGVMAVTNRQFSDVLDRVIELEEQMEKSGVSMDGFELADPPLSYAMVGANLSLISLQFVPSLETEHLNL